MQNPVLATTKAVMESARSVRINRSNILWLIQEMQEQFRQLPAWGDARYFPDLPEQEKLNFLFILDSLNFCFWPDAENQRWRVNYKGKSYKGYLALLLALRKALENGLVLTDFRYLAGLRAEDLALILQGKNQLPLMKERLEVLRTVGETMLRRYQGQAKNLIWSADGSAVGLTVKLSREFSAFEDCAIYNRKPVWFLKRAQIFVADVWGCFGGKGIGAFRDIDQLTTFADYRVPQVLEYYGVLEYGPELKQKLQQRELLPSGSSEEVEIRAATVWAVEYLKNELGLNAVQADWLLWNEAQRLKKLNAFHLPHHRTRTIFY